MSTVHIDIENMKTQNVVTLDFKVIERVNDEFIFDLSGINEDMLKILEDAINEELFYTDIEMFFIDESGIPFFGPDYVFEIKDDKLNAKLRVKQNKKK